MKKILFILLFITYNLSYAQDTVVNTQKKIRTLDETKDYIVRMVNAHCFERNSNTRRYNASFENDYLRLTVINKKGTKAINDGLLWDFASVFKFQRVSKRENNIAFINIWMEFISNEKKDTHKKNKLVLQVQGHDEADQILLAFRHLNELLLAKRPPIEKF